MKRFVPKLLLFLLFFFIYFALSTSQTFANACSDSLQVTSVNPGSVCSQYGGNLTISLNKECSPTHNYRVCAYQLNFTGGQFACEHTGSNGSSAREYIGDVAAQGTSFDFPVDLSSAGAVSGDTWQIEVCDCTSSDCGNYDCAINDNQVKHFTIDDKGACVQKGIGVTPLVSPPPPPCQNFDSTTGGCQKVSTALGDWSTDPQGFVTSLFAILLSLSGTIAFLIMMIAGYKLIMSQGDPEKTQAAKEQITAAIVGLLFIIFSLVILGIIGGDLLKIPGFQGNPSGTNNGGGNGGGGSGGGRIDYGNDANPCTALTVGPNCGLNASGTGLFCAGSCSVGGLADTLYQCVKSGHGYTTQLVKDCSSAGQLCLTGNGPNVPDYCGAPGSPVQGGT